MRRFTTVAIAVLLLGALAPQALAGPPERYTVEFQLAPIPPDFTTGVADRAYVCPVDTLVCDEASALDVGTVASSWAFRPNFESRRTVHGEHIFISTDGSGSSFTVRFQAVPDPTGEANFRENWSVADGLGRYADLRGHGHGAVDSFFVSVTLKVVNAEFDS